MKQYSPRPGSLPWKIQQHIAANPGAPMLSTTEIMEMFGVNIKNAQMSCWRLGFHPRRIPKKCMPHENSTINLLRRFFEGNPDEELTLKDAAIKFGVTVPRIRHICAMEKLEFVVRLPR